MSKILIADDRSANREFLTTLLAYFDHRISQAADGEEALELARVGKPDLIITDILMPKMDGFELIRRLKKDSALARIPIIVYSASYRHIEVQQIVQGLGVEHVLGKPAEPQEILDTVAAVLGSRPAKATDDFDLMIPPPHQFTDKFLKSVKNLSAMTLRMGAVIELGVDLGSERDPDALLRKFARAAQDIVGAKYAGVGILSEDRRELRKFHGCGIDDDVEAAILRASIQNAKAMDKVMVGKPVRLTAKDGKAESVGLPAIHPPVKTVLIVPVHMGTTVYGWLYAAEKVGGGEFDGEDERVAHTVACQFAVAYENAHLYDEIQRHAGELRLQIEERRRVESALKASEEALRQAQKMEAVGRLTGGIAHDFNNLLLVVLGNAEALLETARDAEAQRQIGLVHQAADRAADLTRRLLVFSCQQPLHRTVFDLNQAVGDMADLLRRTLGEDIEIVIHSDGRACHVEADKVQIENTLLNLAINARDAMRKGGQLRIETGTVTLGEDSPETGGELAPGVYRALVVADTGSGMTPDVLARAFEPFFTTKEPGKGTGLGLSTVYGIVKQSGGRVSIESAVGRGTTVRVYLPAAEAAAAVAQEKPADPAPTGRETVLVAEDDDQVRSYVVTQLQRLGYRTIEARNGPEALARLAADGPVDLLFSDIVMPAGLSGVDLAKEARRRQPGLKVLFTSGYAENALAHLGALGEGAPLLAKPYRKADLAKKIRAALDQK